MKKKIDNTALFQYLSLGFVIPPRTIYEGVESGHPIRAIGFNPRQGKVNDRNMLIDELGKALIRAIEAKAGDDKKLGVFLSGGIDSALVLALLRKALPKAEIYAFTVGTWGAVSTDLYYARLSAAHSRAKHIELHGHAGMLNKLPYVVKLLGQPNSDTAALAAYYLGKLAETHDIERVFTGQNADTIMAELSNIRYIHWAGKLHRFLPDALSSVLKTASRHLPIESWKNHCQFAFSSDSLVDRLLHFKATPFYHQSGYLLKQPNDTLVSELDKAVIDMADLDRVDMLVCLEEYYTEQPHCYEALTKPVKAETVFPFFSQRVMEVAFRIPDKYRAQNGWNKMVLRDLAKQYVHPELYTRKPKSLQFPMHKWLVGELGQKVEDFVLKNDYINSVINTELVPGIFREYPALKGDLLYQLLVLAVWHRINFEIDYEVTEDTTLGEVMNEQ